MLKIRLIPLLLFKNYHLVKSTQFGNHRNLGSPLQAIRVYKSRNVDELVFLDIDAHQTNREPLYNLIAELSEECNMPFTVGGGIKTVKQIRTLLQIGADKVSLNTNAFKNPKLIQEAASIFGRQSIVVSVDVKVSKKIGYEVCIENGRTKTGMSALLWSQQAEKCGAGEILINSIDNDGLMNGFELNVVKQISEKVSIPIIAAGGAGKPTDFIRVIQNGASAVAAASIFHFTQYTPQSIKEYIAKKGIPIRL